MARECWGSTVQPCCSFRSLEAAGLHFYIERTRPDSIRLNVTMVGERMEIEIFEDDHLEFSRFHGDEAVEGGKELLQRFLNSVPQS